MTQPQHDTAASADAARRVEPLSPVPAAGAERGTVAADTTLQIELVLRDGMLQPLQRLDQPDGTRFSATLLPLAPPAPAVRPQLFGSPWRIVLLVLACLAVGAILFATARAGRVDDLRWTLPLWIASAAALIVALAGPALQPAAPQPRRWRAALAGVLLLAVALRAYQAGNLPATLSGDEANFGLESLRVLSGDLRQPFSAGWLSVPTLTFFFNAPSLALFGNTLFGLRLPWLLLGMFNVLFCALLAARLAGPRIGLLSGALLAGFHYHMHYSRLAINNIADPFFTTLTLWLLLRAVDRRSRTDWALAGLALALGQFFYFGARLIVLLAGVLLLLLLSQDTRRSWSALRGGIAVTALVAVVVAAPMMLFAVQYPDIYNARVNQTGIIQSGWLAREIAAGRQPAWQIVLEQLRRALGAYHYQPDPTVWYSPGRPLLDPLSGLLLLIGADWLLSAGRTRRRLLIVPLWWLAVLLIGGALTENPPASQRLISSSVPAVIMIACAIDLAARRLQPLLRRGAALIAPVAAALFIGWNVWFYFIDYTPRRVYGSHNAVISTEIGRFAQRELDADWQIIMLGPPQLSANFGSSRFLAPHIPAEDIVTPNDAAAVDLALSRSGRSAIVVLPFRLSELARIVARYPGGVLRDIADPIDGSLLFSVYQLDHR